jgi:medium-chain acyl-[acyl-carrier-protein] hydrolase
MQVCPVQLPGHEDRLQERPLTNAAAIAREAAREISDLGEMPYALFGQSMGTLLCFEAAKILRRTRATPPVAMFLAAHKAPHVPSARAPRHLLTDKQLIGEIKRLDGTSEAVLQNKELMDLLLPPLRADFEVCDTYLYSAEPPLDCPIIAYGGTADPDVSYSDLEAWAGYTSVSFTAQMLPGNHFFVQQRQKQILDDIANRLAVLVG